MLKAKLPIFPLVFVLCTTFANAASIYVVTGNQQFGTVDLSSGAFQQIGPNTPDGLANLVPGPNGSLLSLSYSGNGNLDSINPATGVTTLIGQTGLGSSANDLAEVGGTVYATDTSNNLYSVNTATGAATLIGPTGIPAVPSNPNAIFDETLYGAGNTLYATFDAYTLNPATLQTTPLVAPELYQINLSTGIATATAPTSLQLVAAANVNGTYYVINDPIVSATSPTNFTSTSNLDTLNLATGQTTFVTKIDPSNPTALGGIFGAAPVPEPASLALAVIGLGLLLALRVFSRPILS